jgi:uncharacterized repeat protein (TIGR01451 family)
MRLFSASLVIAAALVVSGEAYAANGPLVVESSVLAEQRQAAPDGTVKVSLVPAAKVVPGDKVVFVLSYRNTGAQPIGELVLSNPLPRGLAYRGPAAGSPAPELSVDGRTFGALSVLRVTGGGGVQRQANADDVRHVRWRLAQPLKAGAKGQLSFQATLR